MSALVGTGLVTLGVALAGVAGLSDDLRAATLEVTTPTTPPLLTPQDEVSGPPVTETKLRQLHVDCLDRKKARGHTTGVGSSRET